MRIRTPKLSKGFTIIELMIVLAIAGIIMAIVFLAIPQLQRSSRDNGREAAVNRINGEIASYGSLQSGSYPFDTTNNGTWVTFYNGYITGKVSDKANGQLVWLGGSGTAPGSFIKPCPSGTAQNSTCNGSSLTAANAGESIIVPFGKCTDGGANSTNATGITYASPTSVPATGAATTSVYAFAIKLDRGYYCVDNG